MFRRKESNSQTINGGGGIVHNHKTNEVLSYLSGEFPPPTVNTLFSGETTPLMFGDTRIYNLDYYTLRERSWQLFIENEFASIIIKRLAIFTIGEGLKLQAEPSANVLKNYDIKIDTNAWASNIEALYSLYASSRISDISNEETLHQLALTAFIHAKVAGDILVIARIDDNGYPTIQLIDGANVVSPSIGTDISAKGKANGTRIKDGVEIDDNNRHIAYWVRVSALNAAKPDEICREFKLKRIPAYGEKSNRRLTWLVYGSKYRLGETRGMPLLTVAMQKLKQLDRYSKAEILSAEENAKIFATIMHKEFSSGENPLKKTGLGSRRGRNIPAPELPHSSLSGDQIAGQISKTTGGTAVNLGLGQELKSHDSSHPNVNYGGFVDVSFKYIAASCDIPQEVAVMLFSSNYSASRAALKMFEHVLNVNRSNIPSTQFYKPIYELFVTTKSLSGFIDSPGFMTAYLGSDRLFLEAYFKSRFIGKPIPNVDELKEVKAAVEKINNNLSTHEKETERLGNGDFSENAKRLKSEIEQLGDLFNNMTSEDRDKTWKPEDIEEE